MKIQHRVILFGVIAGVLVAAENSRGASLPQPRLRLDPIKRTAIQEPKKAEAKEPSPVITMSPFIVKAAPLLSDMNEPNQEQGRLAGGPISVSEGGWLVRKDAAGLHVEVGLWPYRNILWKKDRFKSDMKHVGAEFMRASW